MDSLDQKLQESRDEVDRLTKNRAAFYELMSDMIFLIREDYVIEDMNPSAVAVFGNMRGQTCHNALHDAPKPCDSTCPVKLASKSKHYKDLIEKQIGDMYVEYNFVPFDGYQGDKLVMIVMRDITPRKVHELEIAEFNNNIEVVLRQKIADLNESEKMRNQLAQEINFLQKEIDRFHRPDEMVGECRRIRELREMIYQVAASNATILITGESGTGKELVADLIYKFSNRLKKPYLKFNCAAVPESLLESDLFGYEKGSFTGASSSRKGKFEIADGGTIFLDEIGDISPKMQSALLRVLQNGEIIRVGGTSSTKVDVRVIAATNADLADKVENGTFRKDLYYRLNVINLRLPPLRERKEDVLLLVSHFIKKYRQAFNKEIDFLPNKLINRLLTHDWPGNIRELENVIQRAVLLAKDKTITSKELSFEAKKLSSPEEQFLAIDDKMFTQPIKQTMTDLEKKVLEGAVKRWDGSIQDLAKMLNIGKTALYTKLKRYNISLNQDKK